MKKVKGVIFDWAGTTVDYGCFAPMHAFLRVFEEKDLTLSSREIREPMGLSKLDHIKAMLKLPRISKLWQKKYGKQATEKDIGDLYQRFAIVLQESLPDFAQPLPKVLETVRFLRRQKIKIGSTTGYTTEMMAVVAQEAKKHGYVPDSLVTPQQVGNFGRPYPYMIYKNMQNLELKANASVVKIGDTCSDIKEAVNAGVWSVGCVIGSSELGLSKEEYQKLSAKEQKEKTSQVKKRFLKAGAHYVLTSMEELPALLEQIDERLSKKARPLCF